MCGIAGGFGPLASHSVVEIMSKTLAHRGPDEMVSWSDENCALSMTRLAIVDLETGSQPLFNEDKSIVCIFNGEIFNHTELRSKKLAGHKFITNHADGEVIPHLYEDNGLNFPNELDGMFAIAIWDSKKKNLVLCRDHFGIKPLYYTIIESTIFFASEIKAILEIPSFVPKFDYCQFNNYFILGHTMAPGTAYANIKQLLPAQILKFNVAGEFSISNYWNPEDTSVDEYSDPTMLKDKLLESVKSRMDADVEIGCFLSGGLDSSIIALLASDFGKKKIRTYSLIYPASTRIGKSEDEYWARVVAEKINSTHTEVLMTPEKIMSEFTQLVNAFDEPFAGVTSTYFLSKSVASEVKVALTGDGSDEMFGSYFFHRLAAAMDSHEDEVSKRYRLGLSDAEISELSKFKEEPVRRLNYFRQQGLLPEPYYSAHMIHELDQAGGNSEALLLQSYGSIANKRQTNSKLKQSLWLDFHELLPNEILPFVDRLSMAHSLELRPPFLTKGIYELSLKFPPEKLISSVTEKEVLKNAFLNDLPKELLYREKEGFVLPLAQWLTKEMRPWLLDILNEKRMLQHGLLNGSEIEELARGYLVPDHKKAKLLWKFAFFQIWWESNARK
jgi:asparagine synthase (glutamine-hydrolysing)